MTEVWSRDLPSGTVLTALALADHADHDGRNAFPGVGLLSWKTGHSRRTVQRHLRTLEDAGFIEAQGYATGGHQRATRYAFNFEKCPPKTPREG